MKRQEGLGVVIAGKGQDVFQLPQRDLVPNLLGVCPNLTEQKNPNASLRWCSKHLRALTPYRVCHKQRGLELRMRISRGEVPYPRTLIQLQVPRTTRGYGRSIHQAFAPTGCGHE